MKPTTAAFLAGAVVWVPVGCVLMGAIRAGAREDAYREGYWCGLAEGARTEVDLEADELAANAERERA